MPIKLRIKPSFAISRTENFPELNTIALGGVATGSIKAKLALMVAGIIKIFGSTFAVFAAITRIGNKIVCRSSVTCDFCQKSKH